MDDFHAGNAIRAIEINFNRYFWKKLIISWEKSIGMRKYISIT